MRFSIKEQIDEFRKSSDLFRCKLCNCSLLGKQIHIDHHEPHFSEIVKDFLEIHKQELVIPKKYKSIEITHELSFSDDDKWIETEFQKYHLDNATLRVLCITCNLSKEKHFYNNENIKSNQCLCIITPSP